MNKFHIPLQPGKLYHVFNRATGNEKLFLKEDNYAFFIEKLRKHILPVIDLWAMCLLPNHFHMLVQTKPFNVIKDYYLQVKQKDLVQEVIAPDFMMERFSNCFNSYTKAFNKVNKRKGSLFIDFMRRVEIDSDIQLCSTVFYIHKNPEHHGYCKDFRKWKWNSYQAFLSNASSIIKREKVLEYFQGVEKFIQYHQQPVYLKHAVVLE